MKRLEAEKRAALEAQRREEEEQKRKAEELRETERREAERRENERREMERKELERREVERRETERREAERREAERREAERREAERREAEKREADRMEAQRLEAEKREAERREMHRLQEEKYEKLRQEEEAKRLEEVRLEQQVRRQFELQQQQQQYKMAAGRNPPGAGEGRGGGSDSLQGVRAHIPRLTRTPSFHRPLDQQQQQRWDDHLGKVRTGQVHEKRDFWTRSSSMDRLPTQAASSPAPRRRRLDSWNNKENEMVTSGDVSSRPGSAQGHQGAAMRSGGQSSHIARSKSSAAVGVQDTTTGQGGAAAAAAAALRSLHGGHTASSSSSIWSKEKYDQQTTLHHQQQQISSHRFQEVHTNKVTETVTSWGSQHCLTAATTGRTTPNFSRAVGQNFTADSRVPLAVQERSAATATAAWRTATPEPSLRLVNVSVERPWSGPGADQGDGPRMEVGGLVGVQPPQPPNRNQSYAGERISTTN
jgi:hypothetical protein